MKDWLKKNSAIVVAFVLLAVYLTLNVTGVLSCNGDEDEDSGRQQVELVYTQISINEININYSYKNRRARYKYFLPGSILSESYKGRLLLESFHDNNVMRPSVLIFFDSADAVTSFKINDDFYPCVADEVEDGNLSRIEENSKLCGDVQKLLRNWTVKLEVDERIENALKTPVFDTDAYRP